MNETTDVKQENASDSGIMPKGEKQAENKHGTIRTPIVVSDKLNSPLRDRIK